MGRFRLILFAGDVASSSQLARVESLCAALAPLLKRYTPAGAKINEVIQTLTIHSSAREDVDIFTFPELLRPFDAATGWEYNQIFVDAPAYHEGFGDA